MFNNLRVTIVTLFTSLFIVSVVAITFNGYNQAHRGVVELGSRLVDSSMSNIRSRTQEILSTGEKGLQLLALQAQYLDIEHDYKQLLPSLWALSHQSPYFYSVYIANEKGDFLQTRKLPTPASRLHLAANSELEHWTYLDGKQQPIAQVLKDSDDFNPLQRPWYKNTGNESKPYWSNVYKWSSTHEPGVTLSYPLLNNKGVKTGVVAIDFSLRNLNQLVVDQAIGRESVLIIVNAQSEVVAYPTYIWKDGLNQQNEARLPQVEEFNIEWLTRANIETLNHHQKGVTVDFETAGVRYFVKRIPLTEISLPGWSMLFVVPEREILDSINRGLYSSVILAIILMVIVTYIIFWIASRLTTPLEQIVSNAQLLEQLRFSEVLPIKSTYKEFSILNQSLQKMRYSLTAFSKYVPTVLIRQLMESQQSVELGGEAKDMVVMTCAIAEFSRVTQDMDPHEKVLYLSRYHTEIINTVRRYDGRVDKLIGDRIIVFWGAPKATANDAYRACIAAIASSEAIFQLNHQLRADGLPPIKLRIGLISDELIVGNFGSEERMFYSILGEGVNHSEQLSHANKEYQTQLLVCSNTYQLTKGHFLFRWLDQFQLSERKEPDNIYELIGRGDDASDQERIDYVHRYEEALAARYDQHDLERAHLLFTQLLELYPHDYPTMNQINYCLRDGKGR